MNLLNRSPAANHAVVRERFDAYRDGALPAAETAAYDAHLRTCAACRQWVAQQNGLIADLRAAMPPPHQLKPAGAAQIQQAMYKQIKRSIFMQNVKLSLRTIAAVAVVVVVAGLALWWQFGRGDQTASSPETAETETTPAVDQPVTEASAAVTLTFAAPATQRTRYELVAALFNGLNPDVTVQVVSLAPGSDPATQADTAVLHGDLAHIPANPSSFVDLSDRLQSGTDINIQDYFAGALQGCQVGSVAYGLPLSFAPSYIYFDETVLAQAGVTVPAAEWTWPDLVQTIITLSTGDGTRYGFGNVAGLLRLLQPLMAANLDANGSLNTAAVEPYLQDVASLVAAGHVADVDAAELETMIVDGRIGLWLDNPTALSPRVAEIGTALGRLPVPALGDLTATNPAEATCLTISRGSSQPEAAWRWLTYLAYNPPELPAGSVPANRLVSAGFDDRSLPSDPVSVLAISRAWFSSQRHQVNALIPALHQHVVAGVPLADALAQVSSGDEAAPTAETEATAPVIAAPPPDAGPVNIRFYGDQFRLAEAVNAFHQVQSDVLVSVSFNARLGPGSTVTLEDITEQFDCLSWPGIGLGPTNLVDAVWDLSELVAPETLADYPPEALTMLQADGTLLGLPLEINPVVVRYNENRFSENGLPVPTADWTLNDLLTTAAQLGQTADPQRYGFVSTTFGTFSGPEIVEMVLLEQGMSPWDLAAGTINLTDPAVTAVVGQYVTWMQQNALYTSAPGEAFDEREALVQNGRAALWATFSDDRPFSIGIPEPYAALPLPQLNSQVLQPPWQTVLFISSQVEDPTPCLQWLEFLTTRADVMTAVPARQSVANSRAWQNEVGPANATVLRESLARHLAASRPDADSSVFGQKYPLYIWLQEAAVGAAAGGDLNALLAEAQAHGEQYLACLAQSGDATAAIPTCAAQADPEFENE
ncbi:MAG: extracellular solute-binding protein [Anaerolineaceae bacterium]|nr:extracellular solute-binding protein [Anaerolineaceae bacterium]